MSITDVMQTGTGNLPDTKSSAALHTLRAKGGLTESDHWLFPYQGKTSNAQRVTSAVNISAPNGM
jgi:hypothetical protein